MSSLQSKKLIAIPQPRRTTITTYQIPSTLVEMFNNSDIIEIQSVQPDIGNTLVDYMFTRVISLLLVLAGLSALDSYSNINQLLEKESAIQRKSFSEQKLETAKKWYLAAGLTLIITGILVLILIVGLYLTPTKIYLISSSMVYGLALIASITGLIFLFLARGAVKDSNLSFGNSTLDSTNTETNIAISITFITLGIIGVWVILNWYLQYNNFN